MTARSAAQRNASRLNGARSNGPSTPIGRSRAARNSTKHGFTAGTVPPDAMRDEVLAEVAIYRKKLRPQDDFEARLVETAAVAQVRINRLSHAMHARSVEGVRNAQRAWDEARAAEVDALTDLLATDPDAALDGLRRTTEGCDRLVDLWQDLADALARSGHWDDARGQRFLRLLGLAQPPRHDQFPALARLYQCGLALYIWSNTAAYAKKFNLTVEAATANLPRREAARAELDAFVAEQVAELESRAQEVWDTFDRPARDAAPELALFDASPEGLRLHRHLMDNERLRRRALAELSKLRADEAKGRRDSLAPIDEPGDSPAQNEPEPAASRGPAPRFVPPAAPPEPAPTSIAPPLATDPTPGTTTEPALEPPA
jgi:hypothetical protein